MCGIGGLMMFKKDRTESELQVIRDLAQYIAEENQARGRDASGFATFNGSQAKVFKQPMPAKELVQTEGFARFAYHNITNQTKNILIHTRAKTQGTQENSLNNHPIETRRYIGVHNGMIWNDSELFKSEDLYRAGQVDSEVIFRLLDMQGENFSIEGAKYTAEKLRGMFTIAVVPKNQQNIMSIIRNDNPITLVYIPNLHVIAFASVKYFLTKAIASANANVESHALYMHEDECRFVEPGAESIWVFDVEGNPIEQLDQEPTKFVEKTGGGGYYSYDRRAWDWDGGYYYNSRQSQKEEEEEESEEMSLYDILESLPYEQREIIERAIDASETLAWSEGWDKGRQSLADELENIRILSYEKGFSKGFDVGRDEEASAKENEILALPEPKVN